MRSGLTCWTRLTGYLQFEGEVETYMVATFDLFGLMP